MLHMDWWIGPADMKVAIRELTAKSLRSLRFKHRDKFDAGQGNDGQSTRVAL
jgi:hypothetical protein